MNNKNKRAIKLKKVSPYRTLASNALALSLRNCYPIHSGMTFNATCLFNFAKAFELTSNTVLSKVIADTLVEKEEFNVLNTCYQRNFLFGDSMIFFPNVSFTLALDREYQGEKVASVYILEDVNLRSLRDVDDELKKVQGLEVEDLPLFHKLKFLLRLPSFVQRTLMYLSSLVPRPGGVTFGTVGLTNLGRGAIDTIYPVSPKTLIFGIGTATEETIYSDESQSLTKQLKMKINMTFNHFAVDGKICNEFLTRLKANLENIDELYKNQDKNQVKNV